jgi:hypothetical protein
MHLDYNKDYMVGDLFFTESKDAKWFKKSVQRYHVKQKMVEGEVMQ